MILTHDKLKDIHSRYKDIVMSALTELFALCPLLQEVNVVGWTGFNDGDPEYHQQLHSIVYGGVLYNPTNPDEEDILDPSKMTLVGNTPDSSTVKIGVAKFIYGGELYSLDPNPAHTTDVADLQTVLTDILRYFQAEYGTNFGLKMVRERYSTEPFNLNYKLNTYTGTYDCGY
jgi:hypothetical protein